MLSTDFLIILQDKRWPMRYGRFEGPWLITASYPREEDLRRIREEERRRAEEEEDENYYDLEPWSGYGGWLRASHKSFSNAADSGLLMTRYVCFLPRDFSIKPLQSS